jgi:hypothetical protein
MDLHLQRKMAVPHSQVGMSRMQKPCAQVHVAVSSTDCLELLLLLHWLGKSGVAVKEEEEEDEEGD